MISDDDSHALQSDRDESNVTVAVVGRRPRAGVVGDQKRGETPVPIPNTAVKPALPMILPSGKVGYRRLYGLIRGIPG